MLDPQATPASSLSGDTGGSSGVLATRAVRTAELLQQASEAGDPARRCELLDDVVVVNMPLARMIAHRFRGRGVPVEDLEQVAYLALTRAAREFKLSHGRPFHSYAVPCIRGTVKKYFRDQAWSIRPPRRIQELQAEIAAARAEIEQILGRSPRVSEIAEHLGEDLDHVIDALTADGCYAPISLDAPTSSDGAQPLGDWLTAHDDGTSAAEARLLLAPAIRNLDDRDRRILEMRFFQGLTQQEIGDQIGVTQMHVSRLLARIIGKIRDQLIAADDSAGSMVM